MTYLSKAWPYSNVKDIIAKNYDNDLLEILPDHIDMLDDYAKELQEEMRWVYEQINLANNKIHELKKGG